MRFRLSRCFKTELLTLLLLIAGSGQLVYADSVYVRDTLYVPLRSGESTAHKILHQGIKSGSKLELLSINESTGYSRVKTSAGKVGWIQSQYLIKEPIARDQLDRMQNNLNQLTTQYATARTTIVEHQAQLGQTEAELASLSESLEVSQTELRQLKSLSSNVMAIDQNNQQLVEERRQLDQEIDDLKAMNADLSGSENQDWFILGAGTIVFGILLGFLIGRKIYHRSYGNW